MTTTEHAAPPRFPRGPLASRRPDSAARLGPAGRFDPERGLPSGTWPVLAFLVILAAPSPAHAQLGANMSRLAGELVTIAPLMVYISYLAGISCAITGVLKLKDHADAPQHVPISTPILRLSAGAMFLALPYLMTVLVNTLDLTGGPGGGLDIQTSGTVTPGGGSGGLDTMMINMVADIQDDFRFLVEVGAYLAGIVFAMMGVMRLVKASNEGPRGPSLGGTFSIFGIAAVLLSLSGMMDLVSISVFGTSYTSGANALPELCPGISGHLGTGAGSANEVMQALGALAQIYGWGAFLKGWIMMKNMADGDPHTPFGGAVTHIIAGAICVNITQFLNELEASFGLGAMDVVC